MLLTEAQARARIAYHRQQLDNRGYSIRLYQSQHPNFDLADALTRKHYQWHVDEVEGHRVDIAALEAWLAGQGLAVDRPVDKAGA